MRLLLDNHMPPSLVGILAEFGYESTHVRELNLATAADSTILEAARQEGMCVVTSDSDFPELLALSGASKPSIVYMTSDTPTQPASLAVLLANVLPSIYKDLERGAVVAVSLKRVRIRALPI